MLARLQLSGRECVRVLYRFGWRLRTVDTRAVVMEKDGRTVHVPLAERLTPEQVEAVLGTTRIAADVFVGRARRSFPNCVPADEVAPDSDGVLAGVRVLVVEDDPDGRELLGVVLTREGARVRTAHDAEAALAAIRAERPDVILSDIGMPHVDGYALLAAIRRETEGESIPAIAVTAWVAPDDVARALDAGFQQHIAKPVEGDQLVTAVASVVRPQRE